MLPDPCFCEEFTRDRELGVCWEVMTGPKISLLCLASSLWLEEHLLVVEIGGLVAEVFNVERGMVAIDFLHIAPALVYEGQITIKVSLGA